MVDYSYYLYFVLMCDNIIFMKAGIFFYIFMSFMWMGAAYCAPGDSKLIYHDFPKTMKDVSFIDMLELKTKGYEPWFDKKVYTGITLEKKTAVAADAAGADEGTDYCGEMISCRFGDELGNTGIKQAIFRGINTGVVCEKDKKVDLMGVSRTCVHYCVLDDKKKKLSGDLCFYANVDGEIAPINPTTYVGLGSKNHKIIFVGVEKSVEEGDKVKCGDKLGKIADKEKFFYCVVSNGG